MLNAKLFKIRNLVSLLLVTGIVAIFATVLLLSQRPVFPEAKTIAVLPGPASVVTWAADNSKLIVGQPDGILTLWDLSESPPESRIIPQGHKFLVTSVSMSPSLTYLAAGFGDSTVLVWDLANDTLHYRSQPLTHSIWRIVWSSDSRTVAFSSADGISVVNVETAAEIQRIEQWVSSLSWIPESHLLIGKLSTGTGGINVWDAESGNVVKQLRYTGTPGLLSPDGRRILGAGVWDIETEQEITICLECFVATQSYAWSPDSQRVAIGSGRHMCFEGSFYCVEDFNIRVWNVETDVVPSILSGHTDNVITLAWHPDGSKITSISMDNTARIWDARNHTLIQSFSISEGTHYSQRELNSDGTMLAIIDNDAVRVLNLAIPASEQ